jgi:hypothetical protein
LLYAEAFLNFWIKTDLMGKLNDLLCRKYSIAEKYHRKKLMEME